MHFLIKSWRPWTISFLTFPLILKKENRRAIIFPFISMTILYRSYKLIFSSKIPYPIGKTEHVGICRQHVPTDRVVWRFQIDLLHSLSKKVMPMCVVMMYRATHKEFVFLIILSFYYDVGHRWTYIELMHSIVVSVGTLIDFVEPCRSA